MLSTLLPKLKFLLLSHLNRSDLNLLAQVNKEFYCLINQPWYWESRINQEFPTMLRWFPHEDTALGRESLRAYYYFLTDTEFIQRDGRKNTQAVKDLIKRSSESSIFNFMLYQAVVPLIIGDDSDEENMGLISDYLIRVNFTSGIVKIQYADQQKETPTSCRDQGRLTKGMPREGPLVFKNLTPAEDFELHADEIDDGIIYYYTITCDQLLPWLEAKIDKGYLCIFNFGSGDAVPEKLVQRHYNWFLDYVM